MFGGASPSVVALESSRFRNVELAFAMVKNPKLFWAGCGSIACAGGYTTNSRWSIPTKECKVQKKRALNTTAFLITFPLGFGESVIPSTRDISRIQ